jgi:YVTN family beta-propeller protein
VRATIPDPITPADVVASPSGHRAYTANTLADIVAVINTRTNTVTATIPVGHAPNRLAVSPSGRRV